MIRFLKPGELNEVEMVAGYHIQPLIHVMFLSHVGKLSGVF